MPLPKADAGAYKVPIEITFIDGVGTEYTKSSIIGLVVGTEPDLSLVVSDSDIYSKGQIGNIVLKITPGFL